jgi:integrase
VWRSKPETGRKLLVRLRRVFDYARVQLRDRHGIAMPGNPAAWHDLRDRGFERITKLSRGRQAALDYQQAPELLSALRNRHEIAARALEVTLLTGLRTGEVIGAQWSEIDLDKKLGSFLRNVSKTAEHAPNLIGCRCRPQRLHS